MGPAVLSLDAFGTLVHLDDPVGRLTASLDAEGVRIGTHAVKAAFRAEMDHYRRHHLRGRDPASLAALRRECADVLFDALGPAAAALAPEARVAQLMDAIVFAPFPDAGRFLEQAARRGVPVYACSNWDVDLPAVLARTGLADGLHGVVTSAGEGVAKPEPGMFRAVWDRAGVVPGAVLHVGDDLELDVRAAGRAGCMAVWLDREGARRPGVVPDFDALAQSLWGAVPLA